MEDRQIRLLRVLPRTAKDAVLHGMLEHVFLGDLVEPYTAISYCWGAPGDVTDMYVDGRLVHVQRTAIAALQQTIGLIGGHVWIDAVCINQTDFVEKGRQVRLMKEVYTRAQEVHIWLGAMDGDVAMALSSVQSVYDQCMDETNGLKDLRRHLYGGEGWTSFKYSDAPLPAHVDWTSLQLLYSLPWFTRLWVIQELGLACTPVAFLAGGHRVPATQLTLSARWMVHRRYPKHYGGHEVVGIENASSMYGTTALPLSNLLRRMHRQRCTDPRDRVYGLLGIVQEDMAAQIVPDYSLPLEAVYAQALRLSFAEDKNILLLQFAGWWLGDAKAADWPSWVLPLHTSTELAEGACFNVQVFAPCTWPLEMRPVEATKDPRVLSIRGFLASGPMTYVGEPLSTSVWGDKHKLAAYVLDCIGAMDGEAAADLMQTLVCGINARLGDADTDGDLPKQYAEFVQWCQDVQSDDPAHTRPTPHFAQCMWRSMNRRLFRTDDGRVGMGPRTTRLGHRLAVLSGCSAPFVLRPVDGGRWQLVGGVYCRRLMKPEYGDADLEPAQREAKGQWLDME